MADFTPQKLDDVVKEHIINTWQYYHRNTWRAAKALGVGRTTLYRKLKQYGLETKKDRS